MSCLRVRLRAWIALCALSCASLLLGAGAAVAIPVFDAVITQINGSPIAPVHNGKFLVSPFDVIRIQLRITVEPGDVVTSYNMPMSFDPTKGQLVGPSSGPNTFHEACQASGNPCALLGDYLPSGGGNADSQATGWVGAMGAFGLSDTPLPPGTHPIGVVDFQMTFASGSFLQPRVQFPGGNGVWRDFGQQPVPFAIGQGVFFIPEPSTALLVALGVLGLGLRSDR